MLKRTITFENFDEETESDVFYFNLSKPELIEMEVEHKQGMSKLLQSIVDTKDNKELIKMFKELILMAYGVKSEDGRRFIKTDQLREEFSQTEAFNVLFMELATNDDAAVIFMDGILPRDMRGSITKEQIQANVKEVAGEPKRDAVGVPPVPPTR